MSIKASEISELIKARIQNFTAATEARSVGTVVSVTDGICRIHGLQDAMQGEMLEFTKKARSAWPSTSSPTKSASSFLATRAHLGGRHDQEHRSRDLGAGWYALIGRVVDPLGRPIDGKGPINTKKFDLMERIAPGVIKRASGHAAANRHQGHRRAGPDWSRPARADHRRPPDGQDRRRPRHHHQPEGQGRVCIYVAIGQKLSQVARVVSTLEQYGAMEYTIVVVAMRRLTRPTLQYIAPTPAPPWAKRFRDGGQDALIVYDDLTKHAWAYRQVSLLLRRPPGREAYPGDIFYLHPPARARCARERGLRGGAHQGRRQGQDGSLTALPMIETQVGDVSAYRADQRDFDHRRADLPRDRPVQRRHPPGHQRGRVGVARGGARRPGSSRSWRPHAARARPVPRDCSVRAVRLGPRRRDPPPARPRPGWSPS